VNDIEKYAFVMEGANTISQMICRQAIFEEIYLQQNTPVTRSLKEPLIDLYAEIMVYLSKAKHYFETNSAKRVLTSGLLGKSELEDLLVSIGKKEDTVYRFTSFINAQTQNTEFGNMTRLLEEIEGPLSRMSDDLKNVRDQYDESKREDILHWISPVPYPQHHYQMRKGVVAGTGRWLLEDRLFHEWKEESTSSILWLHGIPGSGKSKLASIVIELSEYYPVTTIIIDALHECDPERRSDLLEAFGIVLCRSTQLVKIFVTSRDDQGITWSLQNYPNIHLSSSRNKGDISTFVETEVESLVKKGKLLRFSQSKDELKSLIIDKIVKGANGM
jgi:hypothetical protein